MRMYDIIKKKRDGQVLSAREIDFFVQGYTKGEIPDYQAAALCMAIWFRGMTPEETAELTLSMRDSGSKLSFANIEGLRVDKHSTGGVGDKTSLAVAPIVACFGIKVAKMSGRGLGHTGGTVDKLEAIKGFRTDLSVEEFERVVNEVGLAIVGQSADLAPADKLLYALRDVTATVDSIPLIASSIMSKKLAADDDCIVLDVKCGSGAFMKSFEDAQALALAMVDIGKRAGKKMRALITDMDRPLGNTVGNTLEVIEAIEVLRGNGPRDLTNLCIALASHMLYLADFGWYDHCEWEVRRVIKSGEALRKLAEMVKAQGGDPAWIIDPSHFPSARFQKTLYAPRTGYVTHMDAEGYGVASLMLGAGRNTKEDVIDPTAGIRMLAKTGDAVREGDPIAVLYTSRENGMVAAEARLWDSIAFGDTPPKERSLILEIVK